MEIKAITAALAGAALLLTGCSADLPPSVVEGSSITVGWSDSLTSLNAATRADGTAGNRSIASATHDGFTRFENGEVEPDESFGEVRILDPGSDSDAAFTVRYDLAERTWSDGIPLDAADLMLAWAAGSGATSGKFDAAPTDLRHSSEVPEHDDFDRRIDVVFDRPVRGWLTALEVAVPAHVVGRIALGVEDPMAAKQAVIDAIVADDDADLASIAEAWSSGFRVTDDGEPPEGLAVGSGPYVVTEVEPDGAGLTLEVNRAYEGGTPTTYERIEVVATADPLADFPDDLDVVQLRPTPDNFLTVRHLRRRDNHVAETHTSQLWALVLRADRGVFRNLPARRAFLRAMPPSDLRSAGAGSWRNAYLASQSLLFAPESRGYEIALEDAGFTSALQSALADADADRARAGVPAGTSVCVLHDTRDPFATSAFAGMQQSLAGSGWSATDCGQEDIQSALEGGQDWQAVLTKIPLPQLPRDITAVWGGADPSPLTGLSSDERRRLVARLDSTADVYDAREVQVAIEAGLVKEYVALPIALDPIVTLSHREMSAVLPQSGRSVTLFDDVAVWGPET